MRRRNWGAILVMVMFAALGVDQIGSSEPTSGTDKSISTVPSHQPSSIAPMPAGQLLPRNEPSPPSDVSAARPAVYPGMDSIAALAAFGIDTRSDRPSAVFTTAGIITSPFDDLPLITGPLAFTVAVEDFDVDGNLDVAIADLIGLQLPGVYFGDGNGGFPTSCRLSAAELITTAYVNDDIYPDVVGWLTVATGPVIVVHLGNGDRTFGPAVTTPAPTLKTAYALAAGHINEDSYPDLIISATALDDASADGVVFLFSGDNEGRFTYERTVCDSDASSLGLGDMNSDGILDLIRGVRELEIWLGDGQGGFSLSDSFTPSGGSKFFSPSASLNGNIVDFDEDGCADIVASYPKTNLPEIISEVYVLFGDGQGRIRSDLTLNAPGTCYPATVIDQNRDGHLDVIVGSSSEKAIFFYYGDGAGGIMAESTLVVDPLCPAALATGDFREDGLWDLVIGNVLGSSGVLINGGEAEIIMLEDEMTIRTTNTVRARITNPSYLPLGQLGTCIAGGRVRVHGTEANENLEQIFYDLNLQDGVYAVDVWAHTGTPPDSRYTLDLDIGGTPYRLARNATVPLRGSTVRFHFPYGAAMRVLPPVGSFTYDPTPTFDWSAALADPEAAHLHEFQMDDSREFSAPELAVTGLTVPQYTPADPLPPDTLLYWRYRTFDGSQWSEFSQAFALNVELCECLCHADPDCDSDHGLLDVVCVVDVAFRGIAAVVDAHCGHEQTDVDCSGFTNVLDVVKMVNVVYRHAEPQGEFCLPCGP
ncbi:MAG TPA: VCBS repeat-containing protein [Acidobacteriota bacterium]|nr:VCBS repeat-containing protein [Acidobacteriota bacterium]